MSHYDLMIQIAAMTMVTPGLAQMCYLGRLEIFLGIGSSVPSTEIFPVASDVLRSKQCSARHKT